nr:MAG TPA: hypothetical protein [Caudoviricetes sp.]
MLALAAPAMRATILALIEVITRILEDRGES